MAEKRAQGRPCRGTAEVGRQKIIDDVRATLRSGACSDLSRKELARNIGVTPALITYYFPKKESLLEEVSVPVIKEYADEINRVVNNDQPANIKIKEIIGVFFDLYSKDGLLLSAYKTVHDLKSSSEPNYLDEMTAVLSVFFQRWRGTEKACSFDAAVLQGAVRGMCEFAARIEADAGQEDRVSPNDAAPTLYFKWLERLCLLFSSSTGAINPLSGRVDAAPAI